MKEQPGRLGLNLQQISTIDLLRHGECEGGDVYRGSTDLPLNDKGWHQMRSVVEHLPASRPSPWQQIITSPLSRCRFFAEELAERLEVPVIVMDEFKEIHFGDWEGRSFAEIWQEQENHVKKFFTDPVNMVPPNGEPFELFQSRLLRGWQTVLEEFGGSRSLLVTHGGVIRALLLSLLEMPPTQMANIEVPYAAVSRIQVFDTSQESQRRHFAVLKFLNRTLV